MRYSFTAHFRPSLFQEAVGEGWAINRIGASHGDCPLPGRVTVSLPGTELYRIMASPGTLTLFLKLTTKWSISEIMSGFRRLPAGCPKSQLVNEIAGYGARSAPM